MSTGAESAVPVRPSCEDAIFVGHHRSMSDSIDWTDDTPITLKEACELAFRGIVTEASLRAEHSRGMLEIFRIGRQDFTTLRAIREMIDKKSRAQGRDAGTSIARPTPSSKAENQSALAAAKASFKRRKASLRTNALVERRRLRGDP